MLGLNRLSFHISNKLIIIIIIIIIIHLTETFNFIILFYVLGHIQRKQAKLQWLQDPSEMNGDNLNNVIQEVSRHSRNKKREYLKDKINELVRIVRTRISGTCIEE
jgi:hypothetical protein